MKNIISNILYFHPQNWTKKESKGNYNSNDPCNFIPQNEKGRKTKIYFTAAKVIFFLRACGPARPTAGSRGGLMQVEKVSPPPRFLLAIHGPARTARPALPSLMVFSGSLIKN